MFLGSLVRWLVAISEEDTGENDDVLRGFIINGLIDTMSSSSGILPISLPNLVL